MLGFPARIHRRRGAWMGLLLGLIMLSAPEAPAASAARAAPPVWGARPLLSYFALTPSLQAGMRRETGLPPADWAQVLAAARAEAEALARLRAASEWITVDPHLSLEQKRWAIRKMGHNRRVDAIAYSTAAGLRRALARPEHDRLAAWIERAWRSDVLRRGLSAVNAASAPGWITERFAGLRRGWDLAFGAAGLPAAPPRAARSYEIFATRYDSRGRYTAALPDRCLKLTNGGLRTCADHGYIVGQTYSIIMSYKKTIGVDVAEAGPWNIDDNFWATLGDPTPRRMFADLPLGMPEAQAAFYNGYNGGQDQYGRKVTAPFAIDLAFEVADDLGLPPKTNDWITVSMMWTEGWNAGLPGGGSAAKVAPVETAAPAAYGSIVHTVQTGQALWSIAAAYGVSLARLLELNGLTETAVIVPGQKLTVRLAGETPTAQPAPETDGPPPSAAARRTQPPARKTTAATPSPAAITPAGPVLATPADRLLSTPPAAAPGTVQRRDPIPMAIAATALLGLGLMIWGRAASRRR